MVWLLIAFLPIEHTVADRVELMELNHCFNEAGVHQYDQLIFWEWSSENSRFQVRAWRLIKQGESLPERSTERKEYFCIWRDREILREVRAPLMRETWTCYDPEAIDRETLPETKRQGLTLHKPIRPMPSLASVSPVSAANSAERHNSAAP